MLNNRNQNKARPRSNSNGDGSNLKIAFLIILILVLASSLIFAWLKSKKAFVPTDPNTLCPTDRPPSEIVVLLLDMSDQFTEPQFLQIQNELDRQIASINRLGLIEVYIVDEISQRVTTPKVCLCNPGSGEGMSEIYQNPDLARKKWEKFKGQLKGNLDSLLRTKESQTSAIFEAIQSVALRTFNLPKYDGIPKRLVIVSDLLQNVPGKQSHYDGLPSFEEFRRSPYYAEVAAELQGVSIDILYLIRPNTPQKWPEHYLFWEKYFADQGAIIESIKPIHGAQWEVISK